jgi:hypothetical protein
MIVMETLRENPWQATDRRGFCFAAAKGRHVIADRDIPTGHVVLTSEPYSMVVGEDDIAMVCHACFSTNELNTNPLSVICPHCEYAYYCDSKCQKVHWERSHERECSYMKKIKPIEMKKDKGYGKAKLRHMVQLFLKRKVEQDAEAAGKADTLPPGPRFSEVRALVRYGESRVCVTCCLSLTSKYFA